MGRRELRRHRERRHRGPRHLHLQIFFAMAASIAIAIALGGLVSSWFWRAEDHVPPFARSAAAFVVRDLPSGDALRPALERRAQELGLSLALWDSRGALLASSGRDAPERSPEAREIGVWSTRTATGVVVRLPDGRYVGIGAPLAQYPHRSVPFPLMIIGLGAVLALAAFPVSARITRRLARLSASVERFGEGDLSARVEVRGRDEIAALAQRFNASAAQIEALVTQQRRVLASASHELRAPLARLRMALELVLEPGARLEDARRAQLLADTSADIDELDSLVSDILVAARAQRPRDDSGFAPVALAALVKQEAERAHVPCDVAAGVERATVRGDARMLARLIRNLIDNARKHAGGAGVELALERDRGELLLRVLDRGPGVPEADRERIFEPFYRPAGHSEGRDGGVGLGLSLVADIARLHAGTALYRAREGGGSVFEVRLPMS